MKWISGQEQPVQRTLHIRILRIDKMSEQTFAAVVEAGTHRLICEIREFSIRETGGPCAYHFENPFFEALFYFDGIGAQFNQDYWKWKSNDTNNFPWDYEPHDDSILEKAAALVSKSYGDCVVPTMDGIRAIR